MGTNITAVPYNAFPCALKEFSVNGIKAQECDFGRMEDTNKAEAEPCGGMEFIPDEEPKEKVLEKYNISIEEWKEVCEYLENVLHVGKCSWCI